MLPAVTVETVDPAQLPILEAGVYPRGVVDVTFDKGCRALLTSSYANTWLMVNMLAVLFTHG